MQPARTSSKDDVELNEVENGQGEGNEVTGDYSGAAVKSDPAEIALVKKLDWYILPTLWIMVRLSHFFLQHNGAPRERECLGVVIIPRDCNDADLEVLQYWFNYLDRNAITVARLDGIEEELNLQGTQYLTCICTLSTATIVLRVYSMLTRGSNSFRRIHPRTGS